jgi:hypothetical protein
MQQTSSDKHWSNSMTDSSPITPPPELVQQWRRSGPADAAANNAYEHHIATQAARWGADQQLELDARWLDHNALNETHLKITPIGDVLKEAMRPTPPSLKEQALQAINAIDAGTDKLGDSDIIRRALEALPE